MLITELVGRVRSGEEVVLRESHTNYLVKTLPATLVVFFSGIALGLIKGGLWWAVPSLGGGVLILELLWLPFRKVPQLTVSSESLVFNGRRLEWRVIESFGAGCEMYTPDWISLITSEGESLRVSATFGWKKEALRDALNDLLKEYHPGAARAQFEARRVNTAAAPLRESSLRFRRPTGPDDALQQARAILSCYYHADCNTVTEVNDRVIRVAAFDPHYFPLHETDCVGCGVAPMKDATLMNGQTLYEAFCDMQKLTPLKAQLGKYLLSSAILCPLGVIGGLCFPLAKNGWLLGFLGGGVGFVVGVGISVAMYRHLRKRGFLW